MSDTKTISLRLRRGIICVLAIFFVIHMDHKRKLILILLDLAIFYNSFQWADLHFCCSHGTISGCFALRPILYIMVP